MNLKKSKSKKQASQKLRKKVFNWSEVHLYQSNFLQNPYFRYLLTFFTELALWDKPNVEFECQSVRSSENRVQRLFLFLFFAGSWILECRRTLPWAMLRSKVLPTTGAVNLGHGNHEKRGRTGNISSRSTWPTPKDSVGFVWKAPHLNWSQGNDPFFWILENNASGLRSLYTVFP